MKYKYTKDQLYRILKMYYIDGISKKDIANKLGTRISSIYNLFAGDRQLLNNIQMIENGYNLKNIYRYGKKYNSNNDEKRLNRLKKLKTIINSNKNNKSLKYLAEKIRVRQIPATRRPSKQKTFRYRNENVVGTIGSNGIEFFVPKSKKTESIKRRINSLRILDKKVNKTPVNLNNLNMNIDNRGFIKFSKK